MPIVKPESFETTEYGVDSKTPDKFATIGQIMSEHVRESPASGIRHAIVGKLLKVYYHTYEMHLPTKMPLIEETAEKSLNECVKHLKKEFKKRTRKDLDLKEKKELRNYSVQKVSLNERYYAVFWRMYEMG